MHRVRRHIHKDMLWTETNHKPGYICLTDGDVQLGKSKAVYYKQVKVRFV